MRFPLIILFFVVIPMTCRRTIKHRNKLRSTKLLSKIKKPVRAVSDDGPVVGPFASLLYQGTWQSTMSVQNDFIHSNNGMIMMAFFYSSNKAKKLTFIFEFFESEMLEDRNILADFDLGFSGNKETPLQGSAEKVRVAMGDMIFSEEGSSECDLSASLSLYNSKGNLIDIDTKDVSDIIIEGSITSKRCNIQLDFKVQPSYIMIWEIITFSIIMSGAVIFGFIPLYRALASNDLSGISNISDLTFLMNIMIEIMLITINMTIAMRILPSYFEFLTLITMFYMISILFKIRFYLHIFEIRINSNNADIQTINRLKSFFLIKFVIACVIAVTLADFFIIHYHLFFILFLYPLLQIYHNCFNVIRKNCFRWDIHFLLILPQAVYPFCIRSAGFSFLHFHQDFKFGVILACMVVIQLSIMYLQKLFGSNFFLPKFLIPNYFEYKHKLKNLADADSINCPICFIPIGENPETGEDLDKKLVSKYYMETPCKHQFHESCLKRWMEQKLVCPCCRMKIPPF